MVTEDFDYLVEMTFFFLGGRMERERERESPVLILKKVNTKELRALVCIILKTCIHEKKFLPTRGLILFFKVVS